MEESIMDKNNQVSDYALYSLGLLDQNELKDSLSKIIAGEKIETKEVFTYDYDEIIGLKYKLVLNTDYYEKQNLISRCAPMRSDARVCTTQD